MPKNAIFQQNLTSQPISSAKIIVFGEKLRFHLFYRKTYRQSFYHTFPPAIADIWCVPYFLKTKQLICSIYAN